MTELDTAHQVAAGTLPSFTKVAGFALAALRVTGSGLAWRAKGSELTYRPPSNVLTPEFLARCAGLPVVAGHPSAGVLDGAEFENRVIGSVIFAYIAGSDGVENAAGTEVWCVSRVYGPLVEALATGQLSTSPSVVFTADDATVITQPTEGVSLHLETVPSLLDHLAICEQGVWDKSGGPSGIRADDNIISKQETTLDPTETTTEADDTTVDPQAKILEMLTGLCGRMSAIEATLGSRADATTGPIQKDPDAEPEKRADGATHEQRLDSLNKERNALGEAQSRADSVMSLFGDHPPSPYSGEKPMGYRRRLATLLQGRCRDDFFRKIDLHNVKDPAAFDAIEGRIYSDAREASLTPDVPAGHLHEVKTRDPAGRLVSNFYGQPKTWMQDFMPSTTKRVVGIYNGSRS